MSLKAQAHAPDTRERLLDAAEPLFAARGFAGTSVRDVTESAGANLGAVNYHFRSKEGLYAEVFARRAALFREPVLAAARDAEGRARTDLDGALRAVGGAFLAPHQDREASLRLIGLFAREAVEPCLPRRFLLRALLLPTIDAVTHVVRRARPDLPEPEARGCAHAFFAQLMHLAKGVGAAAVDIDQRLDHAVRFTVAAVLHVDARPRSRGRRKAPRKSS